jgi:hypothetical protein
MVCVDSSKEENGDGMSNEREEHKVVERARRKKPFHGLT